MTSELAAESPVSTPSLEAVALALSSPDALTPASAMPEAARHLRELATTLVRIRFPAALLSLMERKLERLRAQSGRKIPRAALVRAVMSIFFERLTDEELLKALDAALVASVAADPVKRGRRKGESGKALAVASGQAGTRR